MDQKTLEIIENLGFSDKAARVYLAALELGEATVQDLAKHAKVKRTSIYYLLDELKNSGALIETKRNRRIFYIAAPPRQVLKFTRDRLIEFEDALEMLEGRRHAVYKKPRVYFLYGPQGFKQIWEMIFQSKEKEFRIMTEAVSFLDFVTERYILEDIIKTKKALGIKSRQLMVDSPEGRRIVAKDIKENRESKLLPSRTKLPFTEIITEEFVAFISPRWDNSLFVIENDNFAKTRRSAFDLMWDILPTASKKA